MIENSGMTTRNPRTTIKRTKRTLYGLEKNVFILFQRFFIFFLPLNKKRD
jgi:hypothetical protein